MIGFKIIDVIMSFVEWKIKDKQLYLNTHYPLVGVPKLTDRRFCIHCEQWFTVKDYRVQLEYGFSGKKVKYIVCPNAPECDGTLLDWWDHDFEGNKDIDLALQECNQIQRRPTD